MNHHRHFQPEYDSISRHERMQRIQESRDDDHNSRYLDRLGDDPEEEEEQRKPINLKPKKP